MVSPELFEKIASYWFFEGSGHLEKFRAPTDKKIDSKKIEKKIDFFCCGFKKYVFVKTGAIFFSFSAPGAPWAVHTEKT